MKIANLARSSRPLLRILQRNSPSILTAFGVAGLFTTVILAVGATPKALDLIEEARSEAMEDERELTKLDILKATWKVYVPSGLMAGATITCMIGANSVHLRRNAALMSLYSLADNSLREYQAKVVEQIGRKKEDHIQSELAEDKLKRYPLSEKTIIVTDKGEHLFFDSISGRYFRSDIEKLRKVQNDMNHALLHNMYFSLNELYFEMGLEGIMLGSDMGWEVNYMLEFRFDHKITSEGAPCIVLSYVTKPIILK